MRNRLTERDLSRIVRRVIMEQDENISSESTPNKAWIKDTYNLIKNTNPSIDEETKKNIYYAIRVLGGDADPHRDKSLPERINAYEYAITKYNLGGYIPTFGLINKLKEVN
jgi:hypothetical protein